MVGTPFTFSFLFDYSAVNTTSGSTTGSYEISGVNAGATATFGDYKFTPGPTSANFIFVRHAAANPDRLDLASDNETTPGFSVPYYGANTNIQITNNTGLFSSNSLPSLSAYNTVPLDGAIFSAGVINGIGPNSNIRGSITSLSAVLVVPVPEASTTVSLGVMLGLGGLVLMVMRARRRSRA